MYETQDMLKEMTFTDDQQTVDFWTLCSFRRSGTQAVSSTLWYIACGSDAAVTIISFVKYVPNQQINYMVV